MKQSTLHDRHLKLGAMFGEASGWEMPLHYGNAETEHDAVRHGVDPFGLESVALDYVAARGL